MNHNLSERLCDGPYELRFVNLHDAGRAYAFPCDANGCVNLDALSGPIRNNYLYARTVIGREFATPVTCAVHHDRAQTAEAAL
jgi:hypothetical protein